MVLQRHGQAVASAAEVESLKLGLREVDANLHASEEALCASGREREEAREEAKRQASLQVMGYSRIAAFSAGKTDVNALRKAPFSADRSADSVTTLAVFRASRCTAPRTLPYLR
ncbi:MAG: hypothetical protein SGPRY_007511 [Prymnesium sp.]